MSPPVTSKATTRARNRAIALERYRGPLDPETISAQRESYELAMRRYIERTLAKFPPLTSEQRTRLAEFLAPGAESANGSQT